MLEVLSSKGRSTFPEIGRARTSDQAIPFFMTCESIQGVNLKIDPCFGERVYFFLGFSSGVSSKLSQKINPHLG